MPTRIRASGADLADALFERLGDAAMRLRTRDGTAAARFSTRLGALLVARVVERLMGFSAGHYCTPERCDGGGWRVRVCSSCGYVRLPFSGRRAPGAATA